MTLLNDQELDETDPPRGKQGKAGKIVVFISCLGMGFIYGLAKTPFYSVRPSPSVVGIFYMLALIFIPTFVSYIYLKVTGKVWQSVFLVTFLIQLLIVHLISKL